MTLKEISAIDREIHRLKSRLGVLEAIAYGVSPGRSEVHCTGDGDRLGHTVSEIVDINVELQALELRRSMAVNRLNLNVLEGNCIYMRLKCGYSWAKIAAITGNTIGSVKMMCRRYEW